MRFIGHGTIKALQYIKLFTGNGSYIYIETSKRRKYHEKARLISPWMEGPKRMTFFYSMYGETIESLFVYTNIYGHYSRIWSRHGNLGTRTWTQGCVPVKQYGDYQVELWVRDRKFWQQANLQKIYLLDNHSKHCLKQQRKSENRVGNCTLVALNVIHTYSSRTNSRTKIIHKWGSLLLFACEKRYAWPLIWRSINQCCLGVILEILYSILSLSTRVFVWISFYVDICKNVAVTLWWTKKSYGEGISLRLDASETNCAYYYY